MKVGIIAMYKRQIKKGFASCHLCPKIFILKKSILGGGQILIPYTFIYSKVGLLSGVPLMGYN